MPRPVTFCKAGPKLDRNYWNKHPAKLEYLIRWDPHWGRVALSKELKLPTGAIRRKVDHLKLKRLPRGQRVCYGCRSATVRSEAQKQGLYCPKCFNEKMCRKKRVYLSTNPRLERFRSTLRTIRRRMKAWNLTTDIDVQYLLDLWEKQDGRCYYTGLPLVSNPMVGCGRSHNTYIRRETLY